MSNINYDFAKTNDFSIVEKTLAYKMAELRTQIAPLISFCYDNVVYWVDTNDSGVIVRADDAVNKDVMCLIMNTLELSQVTVSINGKCYQAHLVTKSANPTRLKSAMKNVAMMGIGVGIGIGIKYGLNRLCK